MLLLVVPLRCQIEHYSDIDLACRHLYHIELCAIN